MAKEEGPLSGIGAWLWRLSSPFFEQKICRDLRNGGCLNLTGNRRLVSGLASVGFGRGGLGLVGVLQTRVVVAGAFMMMTTVLSRSTTCEAKLEATTHIDVSSFSGLLRRIVDRLSMSPSTFDSPRTLGASSKELGLITSTGKLVERNSSQRWCLQFSSAAKWCTPILSAGDL